MYSDTFNVVRVHQNAVPDPTGPAEPTAFDRIRQLETLVDSCCSNIGTLKNEISYLRERLGESNR